MNWVKYTLSSRSIVKYYCVLLLLDIITVLNIMVLRPSVYIYILLSVDVPTHNETSLKLINLRLACDNLCVRCRPTKFSPLRRRRRNGRRKKNKNRNLCRGEG